MSRRKHNAGVGYGMIFHGAFKSKTDAKRKERQVHGFIQPRNIKGERRFVVMSQRKNPIRRRRNAVKRYGPGYEASQKVGTKIVRGFGDTRSDAVRDLKQQVQQYKSIGGRRSGTNPMELAVMGANPRRLPEMVPAYTPRYHNPHFMRSGVSREAMRAHARGEAARQAAAAEPQIYRSPRRRRRNVGEEIVVHPGQTITFKFNPSAEAIREDFVGRPVDYISILDEPHMEKGEYAKLGDLMGITYKPVGGGQVQGIGWYQGAETTPLHEAAKQLRKLTDAPVLVASRSKQLYLVGGNQDYSPMLDQVAVNPPDRDDCWELGEARTIVYRERKHFDDFGLINYEHKFGEENGKRPSIVYDRRNNRLLLKGGDYDIRPEGIVN